MRATLLLCAALLVTGCSSAPEPAKTAAAPAPARPEPKKVPDDTMLLLTDNRVSASVVPDHLLGNKAMPGGSLGEYEAKGKKYQLFIAEAANAQDAALLLFDIKATLANPAYIAYMGGYYGKDGDKPVYIFAKKQYIAGVAGLSQEQADGIARELAARLH